MDLRGVSAVGAARLERTPCAWCSFLHGSTVNGSRSEAGDRKVSVAVWRIHFRSRAGAGGGVTKPRPRVAVGEDFGKDYAASRSDSEVSPARRRARCWR